ncbi:MAG: hypothetical protein ACRD5I_06280 [Candidatus Acidiferrales bacterium]
MEGWTFLLIGLGGLLLILAIGAVLFYFRMKSYLAKAHEGVEGTASEIVEEIDSYQSKTQ